MSKVITVGAGAAGMMAAYAAAMCGHEVLLLEKNEKCGKKLYLTGKGRCNLTNAADLPDIFASVPQNAKFLYSSIYTFDNQAVMDFFESNGLPLKIERGMRVFPQSDHSSDVIKTIKNAMLAQGVQLRLNTEVTKILTEDNKVTGVLASAQKGKKPDTEAFIPADAVILACGGCSYPSTGSDGSGYALAAQCGHTVTPLAPSLVPMNVKEDYIKELQGLSLKNVNISIYAGDKKTYEDFGEMLFTHFGVSGPLILRASGRINPYLAGEHSAAVSLPPASGRMGGRKNPAGKQVSLRMEIDLKSALSVEQLDRRLQRMFAENSNKAFKNALSGLLPAKLLPVMIRLSGISPDRKVNSVTKEERLMFAALLKAFPCTITGLRGFDEAIITRGGIDTKQINPSAMESKQISGLFFAGEMIDVDALTGGFNLQIAWSTGYLAGISVK